MPSPGSTVDIEPYQAMDRAGVIDLILPIQQQEFGIAITAADQPDLANVPEFYQSGRGGFWVARHQNTVIGSIGLKDIGDHQAALRKMFVAAPWRGREHAVAARLLRCLIDAASHAGVQEIFLGTTAAFLAAHRFYEKHGFTEISRNALPPAFPVMAVDSKFYRLALPSTFSTRG